VLERYEIYSDAESVAPEPEFEGTNAARFALMAKLGSETGRERGTELSATDTEIFTKFGLNPQLAQRTVDAEGSEREFREATWLIETYGREWDATTVRSRAWNDLNENVALEARLSILAAGLASGLERESATAATAILSSLTPAPPLPSGRSVGRSRRYFDRRIDSHRLGGIAEDFTSPPDEDGEPSAAWPWPGLDWVRYCTHWLKRAIETGIPQELLSELRFLAQVRVDIGKRSADSVVRELAFASQLHAVGDGPVDLPPNPDDSADPKGRTSTMVHGTWGWKGDWWYSGGDFHTYIQNDYRNGLYGGGQEFSWSGAFSAKQRTIGGERFKRWSDAAGGPHGLETVFAHSYGGEIVARAVNAGAVVDEVVLLSAPVHAHHKQMLNHVRRVIDVRLAFDIVLTAAGAAQQLPKASNIVEYRVNLPLWSHSATHDANLWRDDSIAATVGL